MTAARNLAGFAANTSVNGTHNGPVIGNVTGNLTGNVTFGDATTQTSASKWVFISSGSESSGLSSDWLTNNDITYGQYEQIRIVGTFRYLSSSSGNYTPYLSIYKNGTGGQYQFEYHTFTATGNGTSATSYGSNSIYSAIYAFSSAAFYSSYRPSFTFTMDIFCPSSSVWNPSPIWFDIRTSTMGSTGIMSQGSCTGHLGENITVNSSSLIMPIIYGNGGLITGTWEVYGLKK